MQSLLKDCCRDKCYSRLAEIVKLARDGGVVLEKTFYSRVSKELGPWGEDQEALAEVTKQLEASGVGSRPSGTEIATSRAQPSPSATKRRCVLGPHDCHMVVHMVACALQSLYSRGLLGYH